MTSLQQILSDAERRQRQRRAEYETLARLTGQTLAQLDADLTARDPWPWGDDYQDDPDDAQSSPPDVEGDDYLPF